MFDELKNGQQEAMGPVMTSMNQMQAMMTQFQATISGVVNTLQEQAQTMRALAEKQKDLEQEVKALRDNVDIDAVNKALEKKAEELKASLQSSGSSGYPPNIQAAKNDKFDPLKIILKGIPRALPPSDL